MDEEWWRGGERGAALRREVVDEDRRALGHSQHSIPLNLRVRRQDAFGKPCHYTFREVEVLSLGQFRSASGAYGQDGPRHL